MVIGKGLQVGVLFRKGWYTLSTIFVSYSHDSPEHEDKVLALANRLRRDGIETVLDQFVESPPIGWPMWMDREIRNAEFVLMVCTETYLRRVMGEEKKGTGRGVIWEGRLIYQHFYNSDGWNEKFVPVLFSYNDPKDIPGPFQGDTFYMVDDEERYNRLVARLTHQTVVEKEEVGKVRKIVKSQPEKERREDYLMPDVMLAKLPVTDSKLFGRDGELALLDEAWNDEHCHILSFVAFGGVGKTALVNKWLDGMERKGWDGAKRVYGWSFYSQGTKENRQASGDVFLAHALEWFGDKEMAESSKSAWDKGVRLAELIRQEKTLLILDGMEPLQYPPGPMFGKLKDQGLQALLRTLCHGMDGLCVISTREKIEDLETHLDGTVKREFLETLTPEAGLEVLRNEGVKGTDAELKKASKEFGGHALALTLLGNYLSVVHGGEIRKRDRIPHLTEDEKKGGHARRVMESYEIWLKDTPELDILYLMGLFDRPADMGAIEVLKAEPVIVGLTENLTGLSEAKWKFAINRLRELGMLAKEDDEATLDCHPLVREHFGEKLKKDTPEAWRAGHARLYEYYKGLPEKHRPNTLDEMEPLFRAVYHGCQAGKVQETFEDVYFDRVHRGNDKYIVHKLGAFGSDLGAVACFFDKLWSKPAEGLNEHTKAAVLNFAGFALRAVGRLNEAAEPMVASVKGYLKQGDWRRAAMCAGNVSELYLTLGEVGETKRFGERAVEYADKSGDEFMRMASRAWNGDRLHQAGDVKGAKELFREAERMQAERQWEYPLLYSLPGYMYCDMLGGEGEYGKVLERARQTLEWVKLNEVDILSGALDMLSIGRALMGLANRGGGDWDEADEWLNKAVDELRESGNQDEIPRGLLARGAMYRCRRMFDEAWRDMEEVFEIAERGGMKLFLVDYNLEAGRVCVAEGDKKGAKEFYEAAKSLVEETGYHRRDGEVLMLEESLGDG